MTAMTIWACNDPTTPIRLSRTAGQQHDAADAEWLAMRLVREARAVDAMIQLWIDSVVDKLEKAAEEAVAAFYTWIRTGGNRPASAGYIVLALDALVTALEESFVEGTPAFDRVLPAFIDAHLELLRDWRPRFAHCSGDPMREGVADLCAAVRAALVDFGPYLRDADEPAWNVLGVCFLADSAHLAFLNKVLHGRAGMPADDGGLTHRLWTAMAQAYCDWEVERLVLGLRQSAS